MSFAIWQQEPPFKFDEKDPEHIYRVGSVWVVTDDPKRATQAEVDALINAAAPPPALSETGQLAQLLEAKGILTAQDSATFTQDAAPVGAKSAATP